MKKIKYIILIILTFLLDQISKIIIMNKIDLNESITVIKGFFRLTYTHNIGAAFGIFGGKTVFIVIVSFLILGYLLFELIKHKKKNITIDLGLSLLIGGLIGNLVDRLYYGYVRDFLDFKIFNYNFAIFNLGDAFIVTGVLLFLLGILLEERRENSNK